MVIIERPTQLVTLTRERDAARAEADDIVNGPRCGDCEDTGLLENRVDGKYPCTCITETDYWQWNEVKLDDLEARVEEFNMECKRLLDSSLGKEFRSEGQKIKSARKNLRRLMSLPTTGAADRLRIEGMEYLYESVLYDDCPKCKKPPETRDCVYDIIRSRIAKLEKGEKK